MSKKQSIQFFMTTMGLSFCTLAQADQSQNLNSFYAANHRNTHLAYADQAKMSDADLTKKIEDEISSGWFSDGYDQVHVQVINGKVMLKGMVKTQSDKEKLEKEIRNIDGVMSLNSQLSVQNMSSSDKKSEKSQFPQDKYATAEDEQLNQRIRDVVSRGWLMDSYKDITLNTSKGIVTLDGSVGSVDDRQDLIDKIQKIDGVKAVKSNLTVKS